ncbi:GtrA family protein [Gellertiella hungarica]|uniref:GtrA family protein n=1 Tax=Gellertiella hungarica TaxID=1572859 RepID=UPI001618B7E9
MRKLAFFVIAGTAGFLTDAGTLHLLITHTAVGPYIARIFSIALAMFVTWQINRTATFSRSGRSTTDEGIRYAFVGILGAVLNYAVYASLIFLLPGLQPVAAVVAASLAAMGFSYFGYSRFVFGEK